MQILTTICRALQEEPFFYRNHGGEEFGLSELLQSFLTQEFALFVAVYFFYYFFMSGMTTIVAVFVFKIDYTNIESKQLKREASFTVEALAGYTVILWTALQCISAWSFDMNLLQIVISYMINTNVFNIWFYFSHKTWHSNRTIYKYVHEHHHQSTIVCPLTALSNNWVETLWTSVGYLFGPLFIVGANNVWGWLFSVLSILFVAVIGHSRIPFTLEHATHHQVVITNFGFYGTNYFGQMNWDAVFGTWLFAGDVPRIKKVYPEESALYTWNENECSVNWDNIKTHQVDPAVGHLQTKISTMTGATTESLEEMAKPEPKLKSVGVKPTTPTPIMVGPKLKLVSAVETEISVEFEAAHDISEYELQWKSYSDLENGPSARNLSASSMMTLATLSGLKPGSTYGIQLFCKDSDGKVGEPGEELIVRTEEIGCLPRQNTCILM